MCVCVYLFQNNLHLYMGDDIVHLKQYAPCGALKLKFKWNIANLTFDLHFVEDVVVNVTFLYFKMDSCWEHGECMCSTFTIWYNSRVHRRRKKQTFCGFAAEQSNLFLSSDMQFVVSYNNIQSPYMIILQYQPTTLQRAERMKMDIGALYTINKALYLYEKASRTISNYIIRVRIGTVVKFTEFVHDNVNLLMSDGYRYMEPYKLTDVCKSSRYFLVNIAIRTKLNIIFKVKLKYIQKELKVNHYLLNEQKTVILFRKTMSIVLNNVISFNCKNSFFPRFQVANIARFDGYTDSDCNWGGIGMFMATSYKDRIMRYGPFCSKANFLLDMPEPLTLSNNHNVMFVYAVEYFSIDLHLAFWCQRCEGIMSPCQTRYSPFYHIRTITYEAKFLHRKLFLLKVFENQCLVLLVSFFTTRDCTVIVLGSPRVKLSQTIPPHNIGCDVIHYINSKPIMKNSYLDEEKSLTYDNFTADNFAFWTDNCLQFRIQVFNFKGAKSKCRYEIDPINKLNLIYDSCGIYVIHQAVVISIIFMNILYRELKDDNKNGFQLMSHYEIESSASCKYREHKFRFLTNVPSFQSTRGFVTYFMFSPGISRITTAANHLSEFYMHKRFNNCSYKLRFDNFKIRVHKNIFNLKVL